MDFRTFTLDDLIAAVRQSQCWSDVCRQLNLTVCTYNIKRCKRLVSNHKLDTNHFNIKQSFRRGKRTWTEDDLFVENCKITRSTLRAALIRLGHYPGKCQSCGISQWQGKPITIEIDHINGNHTDNRKENLRWLCPNCHSQTPTYRRRKNKR